MSHYETRVPNQNNQEERRSQRRRRVLKGARLVFNGGQSVAEGVVRDVSDNGMRIRMGETTAIPSRCEASVSGQPDFRPARIAWRTPNEIGLALT